MTNDVADFQPIHDRFLARGDEHYGIILTGDARLPRNQASVPLWVRTLQPFLEEHEDEAAMRNRVWYVP